MGEKQVCEENRSFYRSIIEAVVIDAGSFEDFERREEAAVALDQTRAQNSLGAVFHTTSGF